MSSFLKSKKNVYELIRIKWRLGILRLPGGPRWLAAWAKKFKTKEDKVSERYCGSFNESD